MSDKKIQLDTADMLGFRLLDQNHIASAGRPDSKIGDNSTGSNSTTTRQKLGAKIGGKVGVKPTLKP